MKITIHASHFGYPISSPKSAVIRVDLACEPLGTMRACISYETSIKLKKIFPISALGEKWGAFWYKVDFSSHTEPGTYILTIIDDSEGILATTEIEIIKNSYFEVLYEKIALSQLEARAEVHDRQGGGLSDCGGPLREFGSHAVTAISLEDALSSQLLDEKSLKRKYLSLMGRQEPYEARVSSTVL